MNGLPRAHENTRRQDDWVAVLIAAFENVNGDLRAGKPFGAKATADMLKLQGRAKAFIDSLNERLPVVEDEE